MVAHWSPGKNKLVESCSKWRKLSLHTKIAWKFGVWWMEDCWKDEVLMRHCHDQFFPNYGSWGWHVNAQNTYHPDTAEENLPRWCSRMVVRRTCEACEANVEWRWPVYVKSNRETHLSASDQGWRFGCVTAVSWKLTETRMVKLLK